MKNIVVEDDQTYKGTDMVPQVTLKEGKTSLVKRMDGSSLVITEQGDDGMTEPSGNSGKRIACGVISKTLKQRSFVRKNAVFTLKLFLSDLILLEVVHVNSQCSSE